MTPEPSLDHPLPRPEPGAAPAVPRPEVRDAPESGIVEVFNYGRGRQGLIPLWVGEGDLPTPAPITAACVASLAAGETFYTHQRGIPELRQAIADYMTAHYGSYGGAPFVPERFFVTIGGMHSVALAMRIVAGTGDEVLIPAPAWPNFIGAAIAGGVRPVEVPLDLGGAPGALRWSLDVDRLAAAITPATRAIVINTPANPTGWIATHEELRAVLALARARGLWVVADEIYGRLVYGGARAPSFHDVMEPDDRILFAQTFSKNWAMTGWRLGWLEAPAELGDAIENLVQYSSSGVPVFTQRGGIAALGAGEAFLGEQIVRLKASRDALCDTLAATGRVRFARPEGAFYLFCAIDGQADTRALALRLVDEAGVGVAPGSAFGVGGQGFVRICFARSPEQMGEAARRIAGWIAAA